jgi:hypothetical protein
MDWTCILSSDPDHRQARAACSAGFAYGRHPVGFDGKQCAAPLAECGSVAGNDRARDAGDRCTGNRGGSRRSFNRREALSAAYPRLDSTVLGSIRLRRNSKPQRACRINAKTRNSGTFPGDSRAAGRHDSPAPCERCSRPIWRFNACSPVRFHSTKPMKNTYRLNGHWCEIRKTVFG